jgi:hypothetical protein
MQVLTSVRTPRLCAGRENLSRSALCQHRCAAVSTPGHPPQAKGDMTSFERPPRVTVEQARMEFAKGEWSRRRAAIETQDDIEATAPPSIRHATTDQW